MDFREIINSIIIFFQANLIITIAIAIILIFLLFRKTKLFFVILFIVLLLVGVLYLVSNLSTSGVSRKERLLKKQDLPSMKINPSLYKGITHYGDQFIVWLSKSI
jgi:hypothetical protein